VALLAKFFGRTASEGAAFALGVATGPVLYPAVREIESLAWQQYASKPLEAGDVAGIVAEDVEQTPWGIEEASRTGIDETRFRSLLGEALNAPGIGELYQLWRRGAISAEQFAHGLRKAKLEPEWDAPLRALHDVLLSPADLANAVVQDHLTQEAAEAEAALQGYTAGRFNVLVENTGLPPGPAELLAWRRRGIIDDAQLDQGIREGHTKTKYIPFFHEALQPLLSAATAVRLYLKGWYTKEQRDALGAQWGYSSQQMEDWFLSEGRPATVHQVHIGYARGAKLTGAANEEDAIRTAVKQSDIRPEYADLLYAQRYSYPSAFVLRNLVQSGAVTQQEGEQALLYSGWEPTFARKVAQSWAGSSGTTSPDPHIAKAQTQLWTATHSSYLNREASPTVARTKLAQAGVDNAAIDVVLGIWDHERELIRKGLTPANVKKAFAKASRNNATGQPWTRDEAIAFLVGLGWSVNEANDYLDIP